MQPGGGGGASVSGTQLETTQVPFGAVYTLIPHFERRELGRSDRLAHARERVAMAVRAGSIGPPLAATGVSSRQWAGVAALCPIGLTDLAEQN